MSQTKLPAPVFVRVYPPFAMAMGTSFLTWLFGSLTYDSIFGKPPDTLLAILFGLVFLIALWFCLDSWTTILTLPKIGLYMDESGVSYIEPVLPGTRRHTLPWEAITGIKSEEKGVLIFEAKEGPLRVPTAQLLENPEWMLERAQTWQKAVKDKNGGDETGNPAETLQTELEGVLCQSCGGGMDVHLGSGDRARCRYCGDSQVVPGRVTDALKRFSNLIADLPAAHRQFQENTLRRFVTDGGKHRRTLLGVGWGTAGVWLLFALVEIVSTLARGKNQEMNITFVGVVIGLAVLSIVSGYVLAYFIKRVAGVYTLPMQALAPVIPGSPARCRLCGGALPEEGIVRRCQYCKTDSVVVGKQLAAAEHAAGKALQQARDSVRQSTETAARLLDSTAGKMQIFANTQFLWFHIPILVALDGSTGMVIKVTGICFAMLIGNAISTLLGLRWIKKKN